MYKFLYITFFYNHFHYISKYSMSALSQNLRSSSSTSGPKYICGCGKTYTSYPAFSTHRKIKHDNINIQGTILPKANGEKRGRPSLQFKKN